MKTLKNLFEIVLAVIFLTVLTFVSLSIIIDEIKSIF
jgi:hypothetical protein